MSRRKGSPYVHVYGSVEVDVDEIISEIDTEELVAELLRRNKETALSLAGGTAVSPGDIADALAAGRRDAALELMRTYLQDVTGRVLP